MAVLLFVEALSYISLCCKYKDDIIPFLKITTGKDVKIPYIPYTKVKKPSRDILLSDLQPVEYRDRSKKPIILFGCSYTEGFGLKENETFSAKLADYTNRTVYNRGKSGTGLPFIYYQLNDKQVLNELPKNPEYIIYTFIPDHIPRLTKFRSWVMCGDLLLRYKISNGKLVVDEPRFPFLHTFFTSIVIDEYIETHKRQEDVYKLLEEIWKQSVEIMQKEFKNTKIVIVYYECPFDIPNFYHEEIDKMKNASPNIIFFDVKKEIPDIKERKYWLEDNFHPSALAWDTIVPKLADKLGLK